MNIIKPGLRRTMEQEVEGNLRIGPERGPVEAQDFAIAV